MKTLSLLLATSIPGRIKKMARAITNLREYMVQPWVADFVEGIDLSREATVEHYGEFPIQTEWARTQMAFPPKYTYSLRNAEVALITGRISINKYWLCESFGNPLKVPGESLCLFFSRLLAKLQRRYLKLDDGEVYAVLQYGTYFHFLFESIVPLLYSAKKNRNIVVIVSKRDYARAMYLREYLDLLVEYKLIKRFEIIDKDFIFVPHLVFTAKEIDSGSFPHQSINVLRESFFSSNPNIETYDKVFVTRTTRRFANQDELETEAVKEGYKIINPDGMPIKHQIAIFSKAKSIISNHGAGLTNLLYSAKDVNVLEMFPFWLLNDAYFRMSSQVGIRYNCLIAKRYNNDDNGAIDLEAFRQVIKSKRS